MDGARGDHRYRRDRGQRRRAGHRRLPAPGGRAVRACWSRQPGWRRSGATTTTACTCTPPGTTPPCPISVFRRARPVTPRATRWCVYLESYAANFQIAPRFGQRVLNIERSGRTPAWVVRTRGHPVPGAPGGGRHRDQPGAPFAGMARQRSLRRSHPAQLPVPQHRRLAGQAGAGGGHGQLRRGDRPGPVRAAGSRPAWRCAARSTWNPGTSWACPSSSGRWC